MKATKANITRILTKAGCRKAGGWGGYAGWNYAYGEGTIIAYEVAAHDRAQEHAIQMQRLTHYREILAQAGMAAMLAQKAGDDQPYLVCGEIPAGYIPIAAEQRA